MLWDLYACFVQNSIPLFDVFWLACPLIMPVAHPCFHHLLHRSCSVGWVCLFVIEGQLVWLYVWWLKCRYLTGYVCLCSVIQPVCCTSLCGFIGKLSSASGLDHYRFITVQIDESMAFPFCVRCSFWAGNYTLFPLLFLTLRLESDMAVMSLVITVHMSLDSS
jgi:hypothetical protein